MQQLKLQTEQGFAHVLAIVLIIAAVGGVGVTGYYSFQKKANEKTAAEQQARTSQDAKTAQSTADKAKLEAEKKESVATATPTDCKLDVTMYVSVSEGHTLRSSPSLDASRGIVVPYRAALKVGCKQGDWYQAEYNGQTGYAYSQYLSASQPAAPAVTGSMSQDKCLSVGALYTTKDPTPVYVAKDGKAVSANQSVPKGTALAGGECATVKGYWELNATLYSFSDLSTVKP
jgi:hypothetical protein